MFERYTESARRTIFFSRYEAAQFGSPLIESEHLLLGLLRESKSMFAHLLNPASEEDPDHSAEDLRAAILASAPKHGAKSTREDLPLTNECKRILTYAAEESNRMNQKHIGVEHLLLGTLREEKCFATTFLRQRGIKLEKLRSNLRDLQLGQTLTETVYASNALRKHRVTNGVIPYPLPPIISWLTRLLRRFGKSQ